MLPIRGVVDQLFDDGPERSAKRGQHAHPKKISLQAYSSTALLVVVAVTAVVAVAVAMGHDSGAHAALNRQLGLTPTAPRSS